MATGLDGQGFTIEIFEVGSDLTKIESFHVGSWEPLPRIGSFSPTTYRISISVCDQLRILDIRNAECSLEEEGCFESHCFSSDGSLFAASLHPSTVHIWKCISGQYTTWRNFLPPRQFSSGNPALQFSPTSSSILGHLQGVLKARRLDGHPFVPHPKRRAPLAVLSHCGTYTVTGHEGNSTITITNLFSQTPPQFVDTDMEIEKLALTGNILLVFGSGTISAWRLTEEGMVDGGFADRMAGRDDSIWAVSVPYPEFMVQGQTVIIKEGGEVIHAYHTGTGEVLDLTDAYIHHSHYDLSEMYCGQHYLHYRGAGDQGTLPEDDWPVPLVSPRVEWVKDPEGKHRLWIPFEWRTRSTGWFYDITTLWLNRGLEAVIIVL